MAQAKVNNHTRLAYEMLFSNDEAYRPLVAPILKATFDILPEGQLKFSEEQIPVNLGGEHWGDAESTSYRFEPECAFTKPTTDIIVLGEAVSMRGPVTHLLVDIRVGALQKRLGVVGNRQWLKQSVGWAISAVEPFETMPLIYEKAFGGWDRRHPDESQYEFEPRNTVGVGLYSSKVIYQGEPLILPNIEDPDALIQHFDDRPAPVGCGFTLPHWQPRAQFAGTYDEAWQNERSPMLPKDFDRRFFNAASAGLIAPEYIQGNEVVSIANMSPLGPIQFTLPGARPPICKISLRDDECTLATKLDTVIVDMTDMKVQLIWRHYHLLEQGFHSVESVDIHYG